MTIQRFTPPAGVTNDGTNYAARGIWWDGNYIRFKEGFPQKIGGWVQSIPTPFLGSARNLHSWRDLNQDRLLGIGTNLKYYVSTNGSLADITPLRLTHNPLGSNPIATTAIGSSIVTITDASSNTNTGDFVTLSGVTGTIGGIPAASINGNFQIVNAIGTGSYQIDTGVLATSVASGGGAAVEAQYEIPTGLATREAGYGWGAGTWGTGAWGAASTQLAEGTQLLLWSSDNYGQDLVMCQRGAGVYYWAAGSGRAVNIGSLAGASDTPIAANYVMVSPADRTIFAFGVNPIGSSTIDPMIIRWSDDGNNGGASMWTPEITNSAGELKLSIGSEIYSAAITKGQILVWTESSLYAIIFVGGDIIYGDQIISPNIDVLGPNAIISVGDFAMWMGRDNFYIFNGVVATMPCSVRQYVFNNINLVQAYKVFGCSNGIHREIWFFYPSAGSNENDSYVVFNYVDNVWYYGSMPRTAWVDRGVEDYPQAASVDNYIYYQENGLDDGSTNPQTPLDAYIESGPIEIADGDSFVYMQKIIPDITFSDSSIQYPSVIYTVTPRDYPGGPYYDPDSLPVSKVTSLPVEQFTDKLDVRIRGRHFIFRVESADQLGVNWRLGVQRFDMQQDGRR